MRKSFLLQMCGGLAAGLILGTAIMAVRPGFRGAKADIFDGLLGGSSSSTATCANDAWCEANDPACGATDYRVPLATDAGYASLPEADKTACHAIAYDCTCSSGGCVSAPRIDQKVAASFCCGNLTEEPPLGEFCDCGSLTYVTAQGLQGGLPDLPAGCSGFNGDSPNACRTSCVDPSCGDAIVDDQRGEYCDDGNQNDADDCTNACLRGPGQPCSGSGAFCGSGCCTDAGCAGAGQCAAQSSSVQSSASSAEADTCALFGICLCQSDADCDPGETCDPNGICIGPPPASSSASSVAGACQSSDDCGPGQYCSGAGLCENIPVIAPPPASSAEPLAVVLSSAPSSASGASSSSETGALVVMTGTDLLVAAAAESSEVSGQQSSAEASVSSEPFSSSSEAAPMCGNGMLEEGEECDTGSLNADAIPDACRTNCTHPVCGDYITDFARGEQCDQGAGNSDVKPDRCRSDCMLPFCGDGVQDAVEQCDDGNRVEKDGCSALCVFEGAIVAQCGNGELDRGENCDDGNSTSLDGCSPECTLEPVLVTAAGFCGDGMLTSGEECDDGGIRDDDGCSAACLLETGRCGDGIIQSALGEQCEPRSHDASLSYGCGTDCRYASPLCGDGVINAGEECDRARANSNEPDALCRLNCSFSRCGDGVVDQTEECDDHYRRNGDGCDRYCRNEKGSMSSFSSSTASRPSAFSIVFPRLPSAPGEKPVPSAPPVQLPLAMLQPVVSRAVPITDSGPAALAVIAVGAASGVGWMRRRRN